MQNVEIRHSSNPSLCLPYYYLKERASLQIMQEQHDYQLLSKIKWLDHKNKANVKSIISFDAPTAGILMLLLLACQIPATQQPATEGSSFLFILELSKLYDQKYRLLATKILLDLHCTFLLRGHHLRKCNIATV